MNNMITPKEIEQKTMSPEKRKSAKNDYFAFYIGRPLTYVLTIPFLYMFRLCLQLLGLYCWQWEKTNLHYLGDGSLFSCGACWTELMEI